MTGVEILKQESHPSAKFELFQRLNTGGAKLSEQEVRNCVAVMINKDFYDWIVERASFAPFLAAVCQTDSALEKQAAVELVLRYLAFFHVDYDGKMDVHEYLDAALIQLARDEEIDWEEEQEHFERTFTLLRDSLGADAFKRWDGVSFGGKFLMSVYEIIGYGVAYHLEEIDALDDPVKFIRDKAEKLWSEATFKRYSGAGAVSYTHLTLPTKA